MIFVETPTLSSSRSPWQRKNGAIVHRSAKEFAVDSLACPRVVSISNSTLKGQTRGILGKRRCLRCGQPLSVDLDHRVSELVARADRHNLGVATEEGAYSRDKMSDPAYKPPLCFRLALRLQKVGGVYAGHYGIYSQLLAIHVIVSQGTN